MFTDDHLEALDELIPGITPTIRGNALKCYLPDPEEGGVVKHYINRDDARRYGEAFLAYAETEPKPDL